MKKDASQPQPAFAVAADELQRALLADMPVALAVKGLDGAYVYANAVFLEAFGLAGQAIGGRRDRDMYPPRVADEFQNQDRDVAARGAPYTFEQNVEVAGHKRRFLWHRFPVHDARGVVVAVGLALIDITERVRLEAETQAATEAAEKAADELRRALASAETRSMTDPVTGALTRRRLEEMLIREIASVARKTAMPSLLFFELDRFGEFVGGFGVGAADAVEAELVRVVRGVLGSRREIGRVWGGIFGVLLPATPQADAERLARAIAKRVAGIDLPQIGRAVLRVGACEYAGGETLAQWLQRVEQSMRAASGATAAGAVAASAAPVRAAPARPPAAASAAARLAVLSEPPATASARGRISPEDAFASKTLADQPVLLAWHQTYESGNALIDAEHRHLFDSCNALLNAMNEARPIQQLVALARALVDEIAKHFADEEVILNESGYPGARDHARAHGVLLEKAATISDRVAAGTATSSEMFQFLVYDVVAHHLIGTDRRYFKHLRGQ